MFKKGKKVVSIILASAMMCGLLSGCGDNTKPTNASPSPETSKAPESAAPSESTAPTTEPTPDAEQREAEDLADIIPKETVTLTVYSQLSNFTGEQLGWFGKVMLDKFNVKINIINEGDGVFDTRVESGDLGDIVIFGANTDQYQQAIKAGLLFDWEEDDLVKDYGPYINANMATALEQNKNISGGKLYGFGHNVATNSTDHEAFFYHPDIRWDLYKELGYPEVNTLEDYIPILENMVKLSPKSDSGQKTYGVSLFPSWDGDMVMFVKSTAAIYGYDEFGFGLYNVNTQTYEDALADGGMYLRCLKFYNTLYQKGLLDPDSMTQTDSEMNEMYTDGAAFFNIFNWMGSGAFNTTAHLEAGKAMLTLAAKDSKTIVYGSNINGSNRLWTIGAKSKYPELAMAIINYLCTPEGYMTQCYGPKGVTWDYNEQGKPFLTDLGIETQAKKETDFTYEGVTGKYKDGENQMNNSTWAVDAENPDANGETYNKNFWESYLARPVSAIEEDWRTFTGTKVADEYLEKTGFSLSLGTTYTATDKSDELKLIWEQVATCIKTNSWKAIYAKTDAEFDQIVATMKEEAKGYGYDKCVEYTQNEATRRKAAEDAVK